MRTSRSASGLNILSQQFLFVAYLMNCSYKNMNPFIRTLALLADAKKNSAEKSMQKLLLYVSVML